MLCYAGVRIIIDYVKLMKGKTLGRSKAMRERRQEGKKEK